MVAMANALAFVSACCLLVASVAAGRALVDVQGGAFGGRKDYYTPAPTGDSQHGPSPRHSHKAPPCSPTPPRGGHGRHNPPSPSIGTSPTTPGGGYYPPTPPSPSSGTSPTTPGGGSPPTPCNAPPTPSSGTSPTTPGGGYYPPTPSVGNAPPSPPSSGTSPTTPGGGYYPPSPSIGDVPPSPSSGTSPTTPGGGYYPPTPSVSNVPPPPSSGTSPSTPGGGYYPPTPSIGVGPPSPSSGTSPTTPGGGHYPPTPSTGEAPTPDVPLLPPISTPSTPYSPLVPMPPSSTTPTPFEPNTPPFFTGPCTYWLSHPGVIWGLFGFWCPLGLLFGPSAAAPFGHDLTVTEALANTREDGVGALYREGTASLLNSMVNSKFTFTTQQVKDAFVAALGSGDDHAAAAQAELFKMANEGHAKH
ncbi:hypothetical protein GUJ93_ZPchr0007g5737 [Zizania palustris]|uniref:Protodermal factor 1 n=1 Tax=Zizania palustris TaxID=103762 RepID=A0A8J5SPS4_ZIZPA|nr:hypothetical protein GUJ93_ZPchr0007g5737 [Zizania palustris]